MTLKKINSEIHFLNPSFKVKIGTIDKKRPESIYIELGTYIKPNILMESYSDYIITFDKNIKKYISQLLIDNRICSKDFILITDIADERITTDKKSYFDLQLFLKINTKDVHFKNIANLIEKEYVNNIINYVQTELNNNNIQCYKTKK